jgi:hypothetical protein
MTEPFQIVVKALGYSPKVVGSTADEINELFQFI